MKILILVLLGVSVVTACDFSNLDELKKEFKVLFGKADKIAYGDFISESFLLLEKFKNLRSSLGNECTSDEQYYFVTLYVNILEFYTRMDESRKNAFHNTHTENCFNNVIPDVIGCSGEPTQLCDMQADNKFLECLNSFYGTKCEPKFRKQFMHLARFIFDYSKRHGLCNEYHILVASMKC